MVGASPNKRNIYEDDDEVFASENDPEGRPLMPKDGDGSFETTSRLQRPAEASVLVCVFPPPLSFSNTKGAIHDRPKR